MPYVTSGGIGIDPNSVTAGTTTDWEDSEHAVGEQATGDYGQKFCYVQAAEAISTTVSEPLTLAIDENFQASKITKANASAGHFIGVAPEQIIADNSFFWARMAGSNFNMKVAVNAAADVNLWTTATAGILDDTSGGSHVAVIGVKLVVAAASSSSSAGSFVREVIMKDTLVPLLIA